jgi:RNA polymerase sigma-70 factor (ECF subfamily)
VRAGDREAYAVLVRLHAAQAHRAARLFGPEADAEDVVQLAFIKAYQALPRFRGGAPFRPWLLHIVANEAKNAARAARRRDAATQRLAALDHTKPGGDPTANTLSTERRAELVAALRELPDAQQRVVVCRYLLDLDEAETAAVLGWRRGTVKSRLHRALATLRTRLSDVEPTVREAEHER